MPTGVALGCSTSAELPHSGPSAYRPDSPERPPDDPHLQGAQNLADGLGLVTSEGTWPQALPRAVSHSLPGPSVLLWLGSVVGLTPLQTAPSVAGIFATLYLVGAFLLVRAVAPSRPVLMAAWAVVLPPAGTLLLLIAWNLNATGEVAGDLGPPRSRCSKSIRRSTA